jgi:hypothetical protein
MGPRDRGARGEATTDVFYLLKLAMCVCVCLSSRAGYFYANMYVFIIGMQLCNEKINVCMYVCIYVYEWFCICYESNVRNVK